MFVTGIMGLFGSNCPRGVQKRISLGVAIVCSKPEIRFSDPSSPERIVWCYSRWQPAYTEMLVAMPHIEFVKGIPKALEQDSYFDVNKRNSIVFDDQMIDASKDKRIVNVFTRVSHHRIYIISCRIYFISGKVAAA